MKLDNIFIKVTEGKMPTRDEALALLDIENNSKDYYKLLYLADSYSRRQFKGKGTVFSQIGIDSQYCDVNCKFCTLGKDNYKDEIKNIKDLEDVMNEVKRNIDNGASEIFLMTTANFGQKKLLEYVEGVSKLIPKDMNFVVNIGDFGLDYALKLKDYGVTGAYHICRLNEGVDTCVSVERRVKTLDAIKDSGLELYYCVEPIGPEHSNEQILDEIFRAKEYPVQVMAAMKRVAVPGTPLYANGEISTASLAKIVAVSTLCVRPVRAMGVHEPSELCLMSGANQIYAEYGSNPRDKEINTEDNRGFSIDKAIDMLRNTEWI